MIYRDMRKLYKDQVRLKEEERMEALRRCEQDADGVTGLEEYGGVLLLKELKAPLRLRVVCRPDVHMQLFCRLLRQIERLHAHTPTRPTYT